MRQFRLFTLITLVVASLNAAMLLAATPAEGGTSDVCKLVTRTEASELLGAKVVKTTTKTSATNGAEECTAARRDHATHQLDRAVSYLSTPSTSRRLRSSGEKSSTSPRTHSLSCPRVGPDRSYAWGASPRRTPLRS